MAKRDDRAGPGSGRQRWETVVDVRDGSINKTYARVHWSVGCEKGTNDGPGAVSTDDEVKGLLRAVGESKSVLLVVWEDYTFYCPTPLNCVLCDRIEENSA